MGKETQSLPPAVRGLKSGWGSPALDIPSLQAVRSLVRAPAHLRGPYCRHMRMICGLKLWPCSLLKGTWGSPELSWRKDRQPLRDRPPGWRVAPQPHRTEGDTGTNWKPSWGDPETLSGLYKRAIKNLSRRRWEDRP